MLNYYSNSSPDNFLKITDNEGDILYINLKHVISLTKGSILLSTNENFAIDPTDKVEILKLSKIKGRIL